ncbi:MAG: sulfotransferase [Candidatus Parabeggiatoa sp.]|nr:sulfotransferase [Candidatus Parabeggiatoa sp.]
MNAQILNIESKRRQNPMMYKSPTDFALSNGGMISAQVIIENPNISLYCLDVENQRALFVETHADADLFEAPFYYQAQYENAIGLFAVSYETLHQLANDICFDSKRLILIYSVGRCGSTLLSSALNQVENLISFSEPDILNQLVEIRHSYGDNADVNELLQSCIKILCKSSKSDSLPLTWSIKVRRLDIEIADLMFKNFPDAKAIFLYRDAETWVKSAFRAFLTPDDLNSTGLAKLQTDLEPLVPLIAKYSAEESKSLSAVEILTLTWLSVMERYFILYQQNFAMFTVRYRELITNSQQVLKEIFEYCGIPTTDFTEVLKVLKKDSQEGTVFSRENVIKKSVKLPENYLSEMWQILQAHPTIQSPHFIAPNTRCIF